ncbi:hypothetical protein N9B17_00690 [Rhodopirellula sp.]|nr:hypothetical protein [Rhodopirellula sp.]MDB4419456.1 hypothetical protein [bacterium]
MKERSITGDSVPSDLMLAFMDKCQSPESFVSDPIGSNTTSVAPDTSTTLDPQMAKSAPKENRRYVDMWALPGAHPSNVEFMQKLTTAESNQFTTHMDAVGTVSEQDIGTNEWKRTHLVGLRTDVWHADKHELDQAVTAIKTQRRKQLKQEIKKSGRLNSKQQTALESTINSDTIMSVKSGDVEKRRMVLKLFKTSTERVRWCGTIEQVTTTEVHNSIGSKRSLLTFAVILPRMSMVTQIQQNHRTFRIPSIYTFGFYHNERMWNLSLKRHWVSIGADYDLAVDGNTLGEIDGRLCSFGSDSYVDIDAHELSTCTQFVDMMTLFAATVGYHKAMRRSLRRRVKAALSGNSHHHLIEDEELRLRHNGRAAA